MSATCFEGISTNPEILAIADHVFETVRLSLQRATNTLNNVPSTTLPQKGIEKDAFDFLKKHQTNNRGAVSRLGGLSRTGRRRIDITNTNLFGTSVNLNFAAPQTVLEQATATKYFDGLKLSPQTLANAKWDTAAKKLVVSTDNNTYANEILKALAFKRVLFEPSLSVPSTPAPANARELHLKLASLKAVRRFGLEATDWGDDSIACGGDGLEVLTQQHVKATQFSIHTFKRDGENFNIRPDRTFVKFDLNRSGLWPRTFMANVFLAEKDVDGGFIEFLQKLWSAIGAEVIKLATELAMAGIGATIGAVALSEFPIIGTIVGAIIGAVMGYLVGLLLESLKDDIFAPPDSPIGTILSSQNSFLSGESKKTPTYTQDFSLGESRYLMNYYWELVF